MAAAAEEPTEDEQLLCSVIQYTFDEDDKTREHAETELNSLLELERMPADNVTALFIYAMTKCPEAEIRQQACVLFRRFGLVTEKRLWTKMSDEGKEYCQAAVLEHLKIADEVEVVHNALRSVVVQMVVEEQSMWIEKGGRHASVADGGAEHFWPEVLECLWSMVMSEQRESALIIFSEVPLIFDELLERYLEQVRDLLSDSMVREDSSMETKIAAVRAFIGFVIEIEQVEYRRYLQPLLPECLGVLRMACEDDAENGNDNAADCLSSLIDLCEDRPKYFKAHMEDMLEVLYEVITADELEPETRHITAELIIGLCESDAAMMRKYPKVVEGFFPVFLDFCTRLEDDEGWSKELDDYVADEDDFHTVGEQMLDRISIALGGEAIRDAAFEHIPDMLKDGAWQTRAGGLTAIAAIAEGMLDEMKPVLDNLVQVVVPALLDDHPRVRFMACNAVGQMSLDFGPEPGKEREACFQTDYHEPVINTLLELIAQSQEHPRVQAHGAAALVNFCEQAHEDILEPYLPNLLEVIKTILGQVDSQARIVLEQTVTLLATVADRSKHFFREYYDEFMPFLIGLLEYQECPPEMRMLRGKTMECVTLIGLAISKDVSPTDELAVRILEQYKGDAEKLMEIMRLMEEGGLDPDDPQITYMHTAWARICEVIIEDFVPWLEYVLPPLERSLWAEPELKVFAAGEEDKLGGGRQAWECMPAGEQLMFGFKVAVLDEKRTACQMLAIYIDQLKGFFAPHIAAFAFYVHDQLLTYTLDEEIRRLSVTMVPMILTSALGNEEYGRAYADALWKISPVDAAGFFFGDGDQELTKDFSGFGAAILEACSVESNIEVNAFQVESFTKCIKILGIDALDEDILVELTKILMNQLEHYDERCEKRLEKRDDEDHDLEADNLLREEEEFESENIRQVGDLIHELFKIAGDHFLEYFDKLLGSITKMLDPETRTHFDHQLAISIFDDVIRYCDGATSSRYLAYFGEAMVVYLTHPEDSSLRQSCAYGVGVAAVYGGEPYAEFVAASIEGLQAIVTDEGATQDTNREATENGISALLKISLHMPMPDQGITVETILPHALDWLLLTPITVDIEEGDFVYKELCRLLKEGNEILCDPENLTKLFIIFATVLGEKVAPLKQADGEDLTGDIIRQTIISWVEQGENAQAFEEHILPAIPDDDESNRTRTRFLELLQA